MCRLNKGLYGLKQAGRLWHEIVRDKIGEFGFIQTHADPCVFVHTIDGKIVAIIALYVDDFVITGIMANIIDFKNQLLKIFKGKDLGEAKFILGIQITQTQNTVELTQSTYINRLIDEVGMTGSNFTQVPVSGGDAKESTTQGQNSDVLDTSTPYRNIVGKLMYAMVGTRPDIAFAVGFLGRFSSNPTEFNLNLAKKCVRYLIGTQNSKILFSKSSSPKSELKLEMYADSDWGGSEDRKSITGYLALINGAPVSWQSKRQPTVALSSTEAEYMAATQATKEAIWLRQLLSELGHPQNGATVIFEDNNGCIELAKNPIHHACTKHIDIQHHFVREKVLSGEVELVHCSTNEQLADILTKPLVRDKFRPLSEKLLMFSD